MKRKRYKPVRVVNPTATWNTTKIHPCQSVILKMRRPATWLHATSNDAQFDVKLTSDFLMLEKVESNKDGDRIYTISQKYDLTHWADTSNVVLGELKITLTNNHHENAETQDYDCTLCFVLTSTYPSDVLTVVNPFSQTVKLEAHQILEVVCFGSFGHVNTELEKWECSPHALSLNHADLEMHSLRHETVSSKFGVSSRSDGQFHIIDRSGLRTNPRLSEEWKTLVERELAGVVTKPNWQHHWWYVCTDKTRKKVSGLRNGLYPMTALDFMGRFGIFPVGQQAIRNVDVRLLVRGKNKHKIHPLQANPNSVEHKMEISKRVEDRYRHVLTNPLASEQIDFGPGYETLFIEVIQPNVFWTDLADDVRWDFEVEKKQLAPGFIKITPMDCYERWGKVFQRIRIDHTYTPGQETETKFLGAIWIKCPAKADNDHDARKRISFWLSPKAAGTRITPPPRSVTTTSTTTNQSYWPGAYNHNKRGKERDYRRPQVAMDLTFEEIEFDNLEDNTNTIKVGAIRTSKVTTHQSACCEDDFYHVPPKKKETSSTSASRSFSSTSGNSSGKKEEEEGKKSDKKRKSEANLDGGASGRSPFIMYNPDDLQRVKVDHGQMLILRMTTPAKMFPKKCDNEHWALSHDLPGDVLKCFRTTTVGDTFYQEVHLHPVNVPPAPGIYPVGSLRFTCSQETRLVYLDVEVRESSETNPAEVPKMRLIQPTKVFDGQTEKKVYVSEFLHNDAISLRLDDVLYLRHPGHVSGWENQGWDLEIEQYPLPDKVLTHDWLKAVVNDIDYRMPWFCTSHPVMLTESYVFRPLNIQQPHAEQIVRAAADVLQENYLAIGRLTFRNSRHPNNTRWVTPLGVLETKHVLERSLGIVVPLAPYRPQEVVMMNPNHREEVSVKANQTLKVRLSPRTFEMERAGSFQQQWYVGPWPEFLNLKDQQIVDNQTVFIFTVRPDHPDPRSGWINFYCGDTEKIIMAKYEK